MWYNNSLPPTSDSPQKNRTLSEWNLQYQHLWNKHQLRRQTVITYRYTGTSDTCKYHFSHILPIAPHMFVALLCHWITPKIANTLVFSIPHRQWLDRPRSHTDPSTETTPLKERREWNAIWTRPLWRDFMQLHQEDTLVDPRFDITWPSLYTMCPTCYRTQHFFNNSNTNEDIATKFEQGYIHCVRNEEECVCSAPNCRDMQQRSASQPASLLRLSADLSVIWLRVPTQYSCCSWVLVYVWVHTG
jgi:hypothetical protein